MNKKKSPFVDDCYIKEYLKFTVVDIVSNRASGRTSARYIGKHGYHTRVVDLGFKPGDVVEYWDYDGVYPRQCAVNGVILTTELDQKKFREDFEHNNRMRISNQLKEKDIFHPEYNPSGTQLLR